MFKNPNGRLRADPDRVFMNSQNKNKILNQFKVVALSISFIIVGLVPQTVLAQISTNSIFSLTNSARLDNRVAPLSINSKLNQAAAAKANDMLAKDYFAHSSPEGLTSWYWFKLVGYNYRTAGENLAIDFEDSNTVFAAWMNSPSHRANILDPDFNEIGIAVMSGEFSGSNTTVVVQMFGTQIGPAPQAANRDITKSVPTHSSSVLNQNTSIPTNPQGDNFNEFKIWGKFMEKYANSWLDTATNFRKIFTKNLLLVFK